MNEAHEFMVQEVEKLTGEKVDDMEQAILEDLLEENFFEKIGDIVSDKELEDAKVNNDKELEEFLFHRVPNYLTLLEETVTEALSEYLSE